MWKRVLRRVLPGFAALPTLCAILILGLRSLGPSSEQQRALALSDDARFLRMPLFDTQQGASEWQLPLPGARTAPASAQR